MKSRYGLWNAAEYTILCFLRQKNNQGFTLIELIVVILFIGALSAISIPMFLTQGLRARQTEAEVVLGAINRAQQTHRLNAPTFGTLQELADTGNISLNVDGSGNIATSYYQFVLTAQNATAAQIDANADVALTNDVRDYQSAVFQNVADGAFNTVMCRGLTPSDDTPVANADPASVTTACTGNSELVN